MPFPAFGCVIRNLAYLEKSHSVYNFAVRLATIITDSFSSFQVHTMQSRCIQYDFEHFLYFQAIRTKELRRIRKNIMKVFFYLRNDFLVQTKNFQVENHYLIRLVRVSHFCLQQQWLHVLLKYENYTRLAKSTSKKFMMYL